MKNNKGFVLSTYVYMLLVFFLLMLTVMLSVLGNSKLLANKMKEGLGKILGANGGTISIILKGNKEDYTFLGMEYNDPGYIAKSSDGEYIEANISSNIDITNLGTYKITYTVNKFGKTASVERIVTVTDGSFDYDFSEREEEFIVPLDGYYRLEAWGAQGGYALNETYRGGYGGYATGLAYLTKGTKLYINVGGKGTNALVKATKYSGGYNGGGSGKGGTDYIAGGGGGATHIAVSSGLLSTFETNMQDVLIVAGGGGGAGYYSGSVYGIGGEGGGILGGRGTVNSNANTNTTVGAGGTQTTGAGFGQGANATAGPGGGGGLYGGKSSNTYRGAGGGSGYVGKLLESETYAYSGSANDTAISYVSKKGNGYAKITYVGEHNTATITTVGNSLVFEKPIHQEMKITKSGYYELEAWGAQGGYALNATYRGGYGSYSNGVVYLEEGMTLHIYVGGQGQNAHYNNQTTNGGYNGGGSGGGGADYIAGGGGGATHIAIREGTLSTMSTNPQDILIVAGGGGGAGYSTGSIYGYGGDAGGVQGNNGHKNADNNNTTVGTGGTQTTGAGFGQGANATGGPGGGGGLYGGTSSNKYRGAGGGSGYILNTISTSSVTKHMTCYSCQETQEEDTRTNKVTSASQAPEKNTPKEGNGYARITLLYETEPVVTLGTNESKEFDYTGTYKIVEIQTDGFYRLETWGAQGGYAANETYRGGYGGYATGLTYLTKGTKLYVYVGGQGTDGPVKATQYMGGYNGGGFGKGGTDYIAGGGGGATHIALKKGLLSSFAEDVNSVLISSGGGGGAGYYSVSVYGIGGEGGGILGGRGTVNSNANTNTTVGAGGTQTTGAGFGQGANATAGPGGGGGLYGGKSSNTYRGAGGGSGYVGKLLESETYAYSGSANDTAISYVSKKGNGYAKITYVGEHNTATITTVGNSLVFEKPIHQEMKITKSGYYELEAWGAQGGYALNATYRGGYGSYSNGVVYLEEGMTLHIYVGGQGQNAHYNNQTTNGGYNGGGSGGGGADYIAGGGGGATHIAIREGTLSTMSTNPQDILIVAGGGGGAGYSTGSIYGYGGDAGGVQGNNGHKNADNNNTTVGTGGTQTTGAGFGQGANATGGPGGGGGLYGGTSSNKYRGAGGGSGYIGNSLLISGNGVTKHMICYGTSCKTSTTAETLTNSVTVVSETPTADTAKIGNGYAKITLVS